MAPIDTMLQKGHSKIIQPHKNSTQHKCQLTKMAHNIIRVRELGTKRSESCKTFKKPSLKHKGRNKCKIYSFEIGKNKWKTGGLEEKNVKETLPI